jgi:hypothetical protein
LIHPWVIGNMSIAMGVDLNWGAIGVIFTLLYLSVKIRQNTKASKLAAIHEASENSARFSEILATDKEINALFWAGLNDPEALDQGEQQRFVMLMNVFFRRESAAFFLHKEGVMPELLWDARVNAMSGTLNQPGMCYYLEIASSNLPKDFAEFLVNITATESTLSEKAKTLLMAGEATSSS